MRTILRTIIAVLALTAASTASAQRNVPAAIDQVWWGYYTASTARTAFGTEAKETYDVATFIPGDQAVAGGKTLKAVRIYFRNKASIKDVKVWLSTELPATAADANLLVQDIDKNTLTAKDEATANLGYANDIELSEAVTVPAEGLYVGYSFTVGNASSNSGRYPVVVSTSNLNPNGLFLKTSTSEPEWTAYGNECNLALMVLAEGDFLNYSVEPLSFEGPGIGKDEESKVAARFVNTGSKAVTDIDYTITIDGTTSAEKHAVLSSPSTEIGGAFTAPVYLDPIAEVGVKEFTITVTKVNGQPNEAVNTSAQVSVTVLEELYKRTVLIEMFTTERCPNCPPADNALGQLMHNPEYGGEKAAAVCHHDGYYTDSYSTPEDRSYCWFYNAGGSTYAPAIMFDRWSGDGNIGEYTTNVSPVRFMNSLTPMKNFVDMRCEDIPQVKLDVDAMFDADQNQIFVNVHSKRVSDYSQTPLRINVVVTEDSIKTTSQSGHSGTFWHMHVGRAYNSTWGEIMNWINNESDYSCTFDLGAKWQRNQLKVVAYISEYDSADPNGCTVQNAAVVTPREYSESDGIRTVSPAANGAETRYSLDGRQLSAPQRGLNIVRQADGTTRKVVVR